MTCGCASPDTSTCKVKFVKFSGIITKLCDDEQNYSTTYSSLNKNMQLRKNTAHTDNCLGTRRPILQLRKNTAHTDNCLGTGRPIFTSANTTRIILFYFYFILFLFYFILFHFYFIFPIIWTFYLGRKIFRLPKIFTQDVTACSGVQPVDLQTIFKPNL